MSQRRARVEGASRIWCAVVLNAAPTITVDVGRARAAGRVSRQCAGGGATGDCRAAVDALLRAFLHRLRVRLHRRASLHRRRPSAILRAPTPGFASWRANCMRVLTRSTADHPTSGVFLARGVLNTARGNFIELMLRWRSPSRFRVVEDHAFRSPPYASLAVRAVPRTSWIARKPGCFHVGGRNRNPRGSISRRIIFSRGPFSPELRPTQ